MSRRHLTSPSWDSPQRDRTADDTDDTDDTDNNNLFMPVGQSVLTAVHTLQSVNHTRKMSPTDCPGLRTTGKLFPAH